MTIGRSNYNLKKLLVVLIIAIAILLRLYHIRDFMTFLGDEGRDVRVVRDLITQGNLVFIGPQTSVGNMYLGPLYYYMMAPALLISLLDPVGPAIMNALIGTFTVFLTYLVGRRFFGTWTGILASFLYAISPVAIIYSRSSWNPNPMPLFALLSIWGIWEVWQYQKYNLLPYIGIFLAFALQMHYLGLLLLPTIFLHWYLASTKSKPGPVFIKKTIFAVIAFLFLMSPLLLFDIKHDWMNLNAFQHFFSDRQTTVNLNPVRSDRFVPVFESIISELLLGRQTEYSLATALIICILSIAAIFRSKQPSDENNKSALFTVLSWVVFGNLGLGIYKQHVYAHYFGFLFPAIYILTGHLLVFVWSRKGLFAKLLTIISIFLLSKFALTNSPLTDSPNRQLWRTEAVVDLIIQQSNGLPFNFGLIAKQNYDESYRYFFENKKAHLIRGEEGVTNQLFVICEDGDSCQPEGHSAWQIAIFGPAKIKDEWKIDYIKIYRLEHSPQ